MITERRSTHSAPGELKAGSTPGVPIPSPPADNNPFEPNGVMLDREGVVNEFEGVGRACRGFACVGVGVRLDVGVDVGLNRGGGRREVGVRVWVGVGLTELEGREGVVKASKLRVAPDSAS